jgi:hypothetical protein
MVLPVTTSLNRLRGVPNAPIPPTYTAICCVPSSAWGLIALAIRETLEWKGLGDFSVPSRHLSTDLMQAKTRRPRRTWKTTGGSSQRRRRDVWLFALNGVAEVVEGAVAASDNSLVWRRHGSEQLETYNEVCITLNGQSDKATEKVYLGCCNCLG